MFDLSKLQNGSDIRGVALEVPGGKEVTLTEDAASRFAASFVYWLGFKVGKNPFEIKICVGHDPRLSSEDLTVAVLKGITMFGGQGYDAGLASTPAMFMSTVLPQFEFDGAIMITASHMPYDRNGLKFFTAEGGLNKEDITEIIRLAKRYNFVGEYYERPEANVMPTYASYLRMMISQGLAKVPGYLKGMHIVVDAGNGSGGFFAREVLEPMGADISGSRFLDPDGSFPNHEPNPENAEAMKSICEAVVESGADLGILFDTDVDRSFAVGPGGRLIAKNDIIALAAAIAAEDHPGGTVVTDSTTSTELHEFLEGKLGLKHFRYKRGYRNVIGKAQEMSKAGEDAFLAVETSGHVAFSDNYFLDDGAFLALQIVINAAQLKAEGKSILDLLDGLGAPEEAQEMRLKIKADDFKAYADSVLEGLEKWADETEGFTVVRPNYEGVRVDFDLNGKTGWFILRKSLHDPVMPLNIEAQVSGGIGEALPELMGFLRNYEMIEVPAI